jgi:hypothetical protein
LRLSVADQLKRFDSGMLDLDTSAMAFIPHPHAERRKQSASTLIKLLLKQENLRILNAHIKDLIDAMLWKLNEADGKYNTRYRSSGSLECFDKRRLAHEHVYPRKTMITNLMEAKSEAEIDQILSCAIGCVVTREEHSRLHSFSRENGWERYRRAGITMTNVETNERVV